MRHTLTAYLHIYSHGAMIFTGCPYTDFEFLSQAVTEDAMHLVRPLLADGTRSLDLQIFRKGSAALSRAVTLSNDKVVDVLRLQCAD